MNTLTKLALGLIGQNKPLPLTGPAAAIVSLPAPSRTGGMPLMEALLLRQSQRKFSTQPLNEQVLSDLLWAAAGVNRPSEGGRTAPSALHAQEVDLHVALPNGLHFYDPMQHALRLEVASDVRRVTGYQDFVDQAALDLIFVADHTRMQLVPAARRRSYAFTCAGAMAQNVYLFSASAGLATVVRAWFDHAGLSEAMGLSADHELLLAQTVGHAAS
jgi:nitroreductase